MGKRMFFAALGLLGLFSATNAQAYPGMIRHGYVNCTSCHVSPSGGGVLTPYGREMAGEVLSAWAKEGEGDFLWGAFAKKLPETLLLGGDTRVLGTYRDNPVFKEKRLFLMQSDLEAAYGWGKLTADLELGYVDGDGLESLRHYLMYHFDDQDTLRLGKFRNSFGINTDEHTLAIKNNLGWGDETETYNLEYARLTDRYSLYATGIFGAPESIETRSGLSFGRTGYVDSGGGSVRASAFLADKFELGASYFYGKKLNADPRSVVGPFAILGFTKRLFYLGELDFQSKTSRWGVFDFQRLTYEVRQGLQVFLQQELAQSNQVSQTGTNARLERYGVGALFFPRPHFEIDARMHWQKDVYSETAFHPYAWLLLHYYL